MDVAVHPDGKAQTPALEAEHDGADAKKPEAKTTAAPTGARVRASVGGVKDVLKSGVFGGASHYLASVHSIHHLLCLLAP